MTEDEAVEFIGEFMTNSLVNPKPEDVQLIVREIGEWTVEGVMFSSRAQRTPGPDLDDLPQGW